MTERIRSGVYGAVCPGCGVREIDTPSGLCGPCVIERNAHKYAEGDRELARKRSERWADLTASSRADVRLRQQRHRLLETARPREACAAFDPWSLLLAALEAARAPVSSGDLALIVETLRRLAWGPDEDSDLIVETDAPALELVHHRRRRRECPGQLSLFPELEEAIAA